jgi:RNA polymerase sigma-70 factor (ECF subfamily)
MTAIEFNSAIVQISTSLRPIAMNLTRDSEEANDLMQETFLKAFANREKFADGTNLKAWIYTIMKNTFITNYHRLVKRKTFIDTTENLHYLNSVAQTPEDAAASDLAVEEIARAIQDLSYEYRTPFMMHFNGYKYHEIADILNIPIGTVKNRIHIARKTLKEYLASYGQDR